MGATAYDIVPPDPAGTIESLSALGCTLESAISDLVDNSIDAGVSTVDLDVHWNGPASYVSVADDGKGVTEAELQTAMAMAAGDPRTSRSTAELGHFGMGIRKPRASCRRRGCRSGHGRRTSSRASGSGTLERVVNSSELQLLHEADEAGEKILAQVSAFLSGPGTVVLWQGLSARPTVKMAPVCGEHMRNVRRWSEGVMRSAGRNS